MVLNCLRKFVFISFLLKIKINCSRGLLPLQRQLTSANDLQILCISQCYIRDAFVPLTLHAITNCGSYEGLQKWRLFVCQHPAEWGTNSFLGYCFPKGFGNFILLNVFSVFVEFKGPGLFVLLQVEYWRSNNNVMFPEVHGSEAVWFWNRRWVVSSVGMGSFLGWNKQCLLKTYELWKRKLCSRSWIYVT